MSEDTAEEQADFASEEEEPVEFWDKVKHWTRQEHDGQWLSIAVFVGIAVLGATLITQAQVIPGYKLNPILDDYSLIDIAWNEDGTQALALVDGASGYSIIKLDGNERTVILNKLTNSVERTDSGWLVVGDDGWIASCNDPCSQASHLATKTLSGWGNSTDGQSIMDVVSDDGKSGVLLISDDNNQATVRYFDADTISEAATPLDIGMKLNSLTILPDGELIAVGSLTTSFPSWSDGDRNPASPPSRGLIVAVDMIQKNQSVNMDIVIVHIGENGKFHSVLPDSSGEGIAIVAGTSGAVRVDSFVSVSTVDGVPGSTSAVADDSGTIWFAGNLETHRVGILESGDSEGETVEVPQGANFDSVLAVQAGDEVHFHGKSAGERATLDPAVRNSVQSLSVLSDLIFLFIGSTMLLTMAFKLYDNRHLDGW
jgi:hypothetical protein